jgi:hypothetical protein
MATGWQTLAAVALLTVLLAGHRPAALASEPRRMGREAERAAAGTWMAPALPAFNPKHEDFGLGWPVADISIYSVGN